MLSGLSVQAIGAGDVSRAVDDSPVAVAAKISAQGAPAGVPTPTLRLDPALGLVVIEFVSDAGAVTSSFPTQRQLDAYRAGTAHPPGERPAAIKSSPTVI
ncbi:MAG TPA: hypothetical protein VGD75_01060 [Bradyrhizobium sp.]